MYSCYSPRLYRCNQLTQPLQIGQPQLQYKFETCLSKSNLCSPRTGVKEEKAEKTEKDWEQGRRKRRERRKDAKIRRFIAMNRLLILTAFQAVLGILSTVNSSHLHSAGSSLRTRRDADKPWYSLASCLGVPTKKGAGRSRTVLKFIKDNTLIVELTPPVLGPRSASSFSPHFGPCRFQQTRTLMDYNREPNALSQAVCRRPRCDPTKCRAVKYSVPVLKKKPCSGANVWVRATEQVTVAFIER